VDLLSIIIIAVGLAMDSFAVCIGKGMCRKRFYAWRSLKIAIVFGLFQGLMPLAGYLLGIGLSAWIKQLDHWVAFGILVLLGFKMIYEGLLPGDEPDCIGSDCRANLAIDWKRVCILAVATSIDAMATGLIFATYPGTILSAVVAIALVTILFSFTGIFLGVRLGNKFRFNFEILGGVILTVIGLKILLEHLFNGG